MFTGLADIVQNPAEYLLHQNFHAQKGSFSGKISNSSQKCVLVLQTEPSKGWFRIRVEHCYQQLGLRLCLPHLLSSEGFKIGIRDSCSNADIEICLYMVLLMLKSY